MGNKHGFTLIELLLVFGLIGIVSATMLPVSVDFQRRNDLDVSQITFVQGLRRAQQLSMSGEGDSQWGVIAVSGDIIIYKGTNYNSGRDSTFDEIYNVSSAVIPSGQIEYNFTKITGVPVQTGTVTFRDGNYQKTVAVNAKGVVNY